MKMVRILVETIKIEHISARIINMENANDKKKKNINKIYMIFILDLYFKAW